MKSFSNKLLVLSLVFLFLSCEQSSGPSTTVNGKFVFVYVPLARQATSWTCGVAAVQSLLYYYGQEIRQDILAEKLGADSTWGTKYRNIVSFCQSEGYTVSVHHNFSIDSLKIMLYKGIPMLLAIQAWGENPNNYKDDWDDGHYVLANGYDNELFYFMDPSTFGNYAYIKKEDFPDRWHDIDEDGNKLYNFAIRITKPEVKYRTNVVKQME